MANLEDFFDGVIEESLVKPPIAVLKELANGLENSTSGLLIGEVTQEYLGLNFRLQFCIRAPSLNNYGYNVLTIRHDINFYPLKIEPTDKNILKSSSDKTPSEIDDGWIQSNTIDRYMDAINQEELEEKLKTIFSSPNIRKVINGLLAQIKSTI